MATESAHTEVPAKGHFPPFERETFASQLVWLAITFVVLYVMMSKLAVPRVAGILDARRDKIDGDLTAANDLKVKADTAMVDYEKSLAEARARAQALAAETRDKLNAEADVKRKAIEEQLGVKLAEAERTIAATKAAAMANVRGIAADAAAAIVNRLVGTTPSESAVTAAVDDVLKRQA
jgi:F-type H+-transporting ATPase subunit b